MYFTDCYIWISNKIFIINYNYYFTDKILKSFQTLQQLYTVISYIVYSTIQPIVFQTVFIKRKTFPLFSNWIFYVRRVFCGISTWNMFNIIQTLKHVVYIVILHIIIIILIIIIIIPCLRANIRCRFWVDYILLQ